MQILKVFIVPEGNRKQNTDECYRSKHQKHVVCRYGYKVMCVDDKFSKSHLGEDPVYSFITSMTKESKYCSDVMEKHFNKEHGMIKKDAEDFENSTKWSNLW